MSIRESLPVYQRVINNEQDLRQAIQQSEGQSATIHTLLTQYYAQVPLSGVEAALSQIGIFFGRVCESTVRLSVHVTVISAFAHYEQTLEQSLRVFQAVNTQFIESFQAHHKALEQYSQANKLDAVESMQSTGECAERIARDYEGLVRQFCLPMTDLLRSISIQLEQEGCDPVDRRSREEISALLNILQIQQQVNFIARFLSAMLWHVCSLQGPSLGDPDVVDNIERFGMPEGNGAQLLVEAAKKACPPIPKDLTDVMRGARTGQYKIRVESRKARMLRVLRTLRENGMRDAFDNSYASWLALAKVNLEMIEICKRGLHQRA